MNTGRRKTAFLAACIATALGSALPAHAAPGQVYVNLFEWKWTDIALECKNFLQPAGFSAVQISVPTEAKSNNQQWWERYQPVSYKLDSRSGKRADLEAMISSCRDRGIAIYADVVLNHLANGSGTGMAGSPYQSASSYPAIPMGGNDFHGLCAVNDSSAQNVHDCWLGGDLPDLRTGSLHVQQALGNYLRDLLSIGVAGFRIDAAKHIPAADLQAMLTIAGPLRSDIAQLTGRQKPWVTHEIFGGFGPIGEDERAVYFSLGSANEFKYKDVLRDAFDRRNGLSISQLHATIPHNGSRPNPRGLFASHDATVFVSNHDTERHDQSMNASYGKMFNLANIFMLAYPYGQPQLQSGFKLSYPKDAKGRAPNDQPVPLAPIYDANGQANFSDWDIQHRWPEITNMVAFRNQTQSQWRVDDWVSDGPDRLAFHRGDKGFLAINRHDTARWTGRFKTGLSAGTYCNIMSGTLNAGKTQCSGQSIKVNDDGSADLNIPAMNEAGMPAVALHAGQKIIGPTVDTTPPVFNGPPVIEFPGNGRARISWPAASDPESEIAGYRVYLNGTLHSSTRQTSVLLTGLLPNKTYSLMVRAVNGARLVSKPGPVISFKLPPEECKVSVTFQVRDAGTVWGQNVYLTGSGTVLGNWNTSSAALMSASSWPLWKITRELPAGSSIEYKYIRKGVKPLQWEAGSNRLFTVPACGSAPVSIPLSDFRT